MSLEGPQEEAEWAAVKVRQMDDWLEAEFLDSLCKADAILDGQMEHYSDYLT